jgi:hypothetical protein
MIAAHFFIPLGIGLVCLIAAARAGWKIWPIWLFGLPVIFSVTLWDLVFLGLA